MPWWLTIAVTTIVLRTCITLPLTIYQQKKSAKLVLLQPVVKEISEAVKYNVATKCRRENLPVEVAEERYKILVCLLLLRIRFTFNVASCYFK